MQSKRHAALFLCLIVAVLVSTALARLEVRKCVEGKTYFDGCNQCSCLDGRRACTMKICTIWDPIREESVQKPVQDPPTDFWEPIPDAPLPNE